MQIKKIPSLWWNAKDHGLCSHRKNLQSDMAKKKPVVYLSSPVTNTINKIIPMGIASGAFMVTEMKQLLTK